jgi:hypothetical protein
MILSGPLVQRCLILIQRNLIDGLLFYILVLHADLQSCSFSAHIQITGIVYRVTVNSFRITFNPSTNDVKSGVAIFLLHSKSS